MDPSVGGEVRASRGRRELGAWPNQLYRADLRVRVERAGESSPASAKRSEVIRLRHSSSIAEGWTGSYRASTLREQRPVRSSQRVAGCGPDHLSLARPGLNRGYASCRGDGTSRIAPSRHHEGEGSLHGLVGLFWSTKSHVIKTHGSSLTPLSMRVVFSLFICVKVVAPSPVK